MISTLPSGLIVVDPSAMVTVVLQTPLGQRVLNAVNCRYVPATVAIVAQPPHRVVAVEVFHDPAEPMPTQAYYCHPNQLTKELFPATALLHVRPYSPMPPP